MNKYDNFELFMLAVLDAANEECKKGSGKTLSERWNLPESTYQVIVKLIKTDWRRFSLLAVLDSVETSILPAELKSICSKDEIRILYTNNALPILIYQVGDRVKEDFKSHINEVPLIDSLIIKTAKYIIDKIKDYD